jgi:hypothetical protein
MNILWRVLSRVLFLLLGGLIVAMSIFSVARKDDLAQLSGAQMMEKALSTAQKLFF